MDNTMLTQMQMCVVVSHQKKKPKPIKSCISLIHKKKEELFYRKSTKEQCCLLSYSSG